MNSQTEATTDVNAVENLIEQIKIDQDTVIEDQIKNKEFIKVDTKDLFDLDESLKGIKYLQVHKDKHLLTPTIQDHVFEPSVLRRRILSMQDNDPIMLVGEKGSGKSSGILQMMARLNRPTLALTCNGGVLDEHLFGRLDFDGNKVTSVDGIVTHGFRRGYNVMLDEISTLRPSVSIGLMDFLEKGDVITLKHLGFHGDLSPEQLIGNQAIVRHRSARFWATDNVGGTMVRDPRKAGTQPMNDALRSRFVFFKENYLPKELEFKALASVAKAHRNHAEMTDTLLSLMIDFANQMRYAQELGKCIGGFSFRELKRWVTKYLSYGDLEEAFCDAAYTGMELLDREVAKNWYHDTFGSELTLTPELAWSAKTQLPNGGVKIAA